MGYAISTPYQIVQTNSTLKNTAIFSTVLNDNLVNTMTTPIFERPPTKVYVDIICHVIKNNAANVNAIDEGKIALFDGVNFIDCGNIESGSAWIESSTTAHIPFMFPGSTNIAAKVSSNTSYQSYFHDAKSFFDTLELRDLYTRFNFYFGV